MQGNVGNDIFQPPNPDGQRGFGDGENTGPYKFSPEELRVLNECNRESFFKRCLPFGSILSFGAYYGVKIGYFKGHPKWGSIPKVAAGAFIGYFLGKFSYQWTCAQKLMEVPNSKLGQMLRERRRAGKGGFQETLEPGFGTGISIPSTFSINDEPETDESNSYKNYVDIDNRPQTDYDFQRSIQYDGSSMELSGLPEKPPEHKITYDELRKKNRDEYEIQRSRYVARPTSPPPPQTPPSNIPLYNQPLNPSEPYYSNPEPPQPSSWSSSQYENTWK